MKPTKFLTLILFIFLAFGMQAQDEQPSEQAPQEKPKEDEKPKDGGRPQRGEGQRPPRGEGEGRPGGRGRFTKAQWEQFSEMMPKIGVVSGTVLEKESGKPVEYASVALLLTIDSSLVSGAVTNEKGEFSIEEIPVGPYFVTIDFMGFETYTSEQIRISPRGNPEVDLGTIMMTVSAEVLSEVEVVEKRPFMEIELDKKIFNVGDNVTVTGGTATEVLEQIPSVDVDIDGNVSLRGSQNLTILIDGRPTAIAGGDPATILQQIPSDAIDKVEVITSPSAKYDPEGMTGILNIILKKNRKIGLTGVVDVNWQPNDPKEYGLGANLGWRNKKVNLFLNYNYRDNERESVRENERINTFADTTFSFLQEGTDKRRRQSHVAKIGAEFFPTKSTVLYTSTSFGFQSSDDVSDNIYEFYDEMNIYTQQTRIDESEVDNGNNKAFNIGFEKRFKNDYNHKLVVDLNYSDNFSEEISSLMNAEYALNDKDYEDPIAIIGTQTDQVDNLRRVITASADYEKAYENKSKFEAGYRSLVRSSDNTFDSTNDFLDNQFIFKEQIHAVYSTFAYPITEKFSAKGGLRIEQALTDGELVTSNETFEQNYLSFFPSASLSYDFDAKGTLSLSYSRRVNRPRSRQVNPFVNFSDPLNFRQGNPNLVPEFTNGVELNYMKRWDKLTFTPSLYYRHTNNIINRIVRVDDQTGISTLTFENLNTAQAYGLELNFVYTPFDWWRIIPSIDLTQTILDSDNVDADLNDNNFRAGGRFISNITIKKKTDIQTFVFYRLPGETAQGRIGTLFFATLGARTKILKDKGTIGLNIRNPFALGRFTFEAEDETFFFSGFRQREPNIITLSFSYRFGKQQRQQRRGNRGDRGQGGGGMDDFDMM